MSHAVARRLPGIRFDGAPRTLDEVLPRMDIAAFVGFAECGPINLPVAIEAPDDFTAIFGGELRLAWDRQRGRWSVAQLANAVRAFFANGGTRCWVVRVAGDDAMSNQFALPGLRRASPPVRAGEVWRLEKATAHARSEGSWSDGLRIATRLRRRSARILDASLFGAGDIELTVSATPALTRGDLLRVLDADGSRAVFVPVREVIAGRADAPANTLVVRSDRAFLVLSPILSSPGSTSDPQVSAVGTAFLLAPDARHEVVTVDLRIEDTGRAARAGTASPRTYRLDNLALVPGHARYWADVPSDAAWYSTTTEQRVASGTPPDWCFCPIVAERADGDTGFFVPWGLTDQFGPGTAPAAAMAPRLLRDGIERFDAALFSDPSLRDVNRRNLIDLADTLRYRSDRPRRLSGMHSLLGWSTDSVGEEASVFAIPDAVQLPWTRAPDADVQARFEVVGTPATGLPDDARWFGECAARLPMPVLAGVPAAFTAHTAGTLSWTHDAVAGSRRYRIERHLQAAALSADFETVLAAREFEFALPEHEPGEYYYRVRVERDDETGPWSSLLRLVVPDRHDYEIDPSADHAVGLQSIQRTMLTLAAARGDLFSILSLPALWRAADALRHAQGLRDPAAEDGSLASTGSYGALYHPWVVASDGVASAPDGTIVGIVARRTRERGAWVAPANVALRDVLALTPVVLPERWPDLQESRINVLRREPSGLTVLSADTLADEDELRPIQVRRLLATLRRLAQRLGAEFVFEANGEALQSAVENRFERALESLYRRGAFAGRKPDDSFQVSVRAEANPPQHRDAGRFLVEIRVRPAQALRFITVRLTQSGLQSLVTELL